MSWNQLTQPETIDELEKFPILFNLLSFQTLTLMSNFQNLIKLRFLILIHGIHINSFSTIFSPNITQQIKH